MSAKQSAESFWARTKATASGCIEWQGARNRTGCYGLVRWNGKQYVSHRIAAFLVGKVKSPAAPRDMKSDQFVLHTCNNKLCCNPAHLYVGTRSQNMLDAYADGLKQPMRGTKHPGAKFTRNQIQEIRVLHLKGVIQSELARKFSTTSRTISRIINFNSYHL